MRGKKPERIRGRNDVPKNPLARKVHMNFKLAHDVAIFLTAQQQQGKNKTAIIENAIRKVYFDG